MIYKYNAKMEDGILRVYRERVIAEDAIVTGMADTARLLARLAYAEQLPTELFTVMLLDVKCAILGIAEVSRGNVNSALVPMGLVIQYATQTNAQGIVCAHNHPSEDVTPSTEDIVMNKKLRKACGYCDIHMLDNFIITSKEIASVDTGVIIRRRNE